MKSFECIFFCFEQRGPKSKGINIVKIFHIIQWNYSWNISTPKTDMTSYKQHQDFIWPSGKNKFSVCVINIPEKWWQLFHVTLVYHYQGFDLTWLGPFSCFWLDYDLTRINILIRLFCWLDSEKKSDLTQLLTWLESKNHSSQTPDHYKKSNVVGHSQSAPIFYNKIKLFSFIVSAWLNSR